MAQILDPIGKPTPVVLTYIDKGLGASILKAGLRLWDAGAASPVAAIKITRHNLLRPTAVIHEAGHQVAHIAGWNQELSAALSQGLADGVERARGRRGPAGRLRSPPTLSPSFTPASPASRRFTTCSPAEPSSVFPHTPGDPHPICYLRVLLGVEMCRYFYGAGPWDDLARVVDDAALRRGGAERDAPAARRFDAGC